MKTALAIVRAGGWALVACFGVTTVTTLAACGAGSDDGTQSTSEELRRRHHDAGADAAPRPPPPQPDASSGGSGGGDDGTPVRQACTSRFGSALSASFGRLDGYLVSVVPPGAHGCNGDAHHVHLQIEMHGAVYDVAVNVSSTESSNPEVYVADTTAQLAGGVWSEGWHPGARLDYPSDLGLRSNAFTPESESALAHDLESAVAQANHVSVFATGYGSDGVHLVHRNGSGHDGAIVVDPLSAAPHYYVFHFANQSF